MNSRTSIASTGFRSARRGNFLGFLREILIVRKQRIRLADLDDQILRDIGLSRDEALHEASRSLWDVPDRWRA